MGRKKLDNDLEAGSAARQAATQRSRRVFEAAADIGTLPPIADPKRRKAGGESLLYFLTTYFPNSTGLSPLGQDQLDMIDRIEVALREEGWVANIMPRGFIKSTVSENSILWALLYGIRRYCLFFAGTASLAEKGITSIKQELLTNELLLADFPEACIPFLKLEGKSQRCASQSYGGKLTNLMCNRDVLRLAQIPGWDGAGGIVESYGLLAPPRGARYKNEKGENVRPDIAVCDDPQTDDSARSETQVNSRMRYIKNSISMMGGHGSELSIIINATIIADGDLADQISDPTISQEWQAVRIPMVKSLPTQLDKLWLGEYATIRRTYDRSDPRGRIKAKEASTEFLKAHYDEMHHGAEVSWENIGLEKTEISALQHAMNILIDKGPNTFWAECQNKPLRPTSVSTLEITREVGSRTSGYDKNVIPLDASHLVFGVDVHDELLYYTVAAVANDFTGNILSYGTFPEQTTSHFNLRSAKQTLSKHYRLSKGEDAERAIELGVEEIVGKLLHSDWRNVNGDPIRVSCGLVDVGYKSTEVANALRRLLPASQVVLMSRGIGIGPTKKPMPEYDTSPGKVIKAGPDPSYPRWILPTNGRDGSLYQVQFDANFWKDTLAARLVQTSRVGRWQLYGNEKTDHSHYTSHLISETVNQVTANGRTVNMWENTSVDRQNHWWDTTVLCAIAASLCGAVLPVAKPQEPEDETVTTAVQQQPESFNDNMEEMFTTEDGRSFFAHNR